MGAAAVSDLRRTLAAMTLALAWCAVPGAARAQQAPPAEDPDDAVLAAMRAEVERAMGILANTEMPPYVLGVEVTEATAVHLAGEEGALQGYAPGTSRRVDVDIRIGGPELDSTHALRSGRDAAGRGHGRELALGDDRGVIQRGIWREVDARYVEAAERWAKVVSDKAVLVDEEPAEDLAPVEPVQALYPREPFDVDLSAWEETVRQASAVLAGSPVIHDGSAQLVGGVETRWFVSSEGTRVRHSSSHWRFIIRVDTVADDGTALQLSTILDARHPSGLPDREALVEEARRIERQIAALREAPEEEPYAGPAILTGRAAAVFFHEILGHRLEGHRLKRIDDAQTFRNMLGQPILPPFLSVADDPTVSRMAGVDLSGHYLFDNQGVPAQRAPLVEDGVLVGFLQSRSPVRQGERSNGHGRRSAGKDAVTRQGNLIVSASETMTDAELRAELVRLAREAGLEYGLLLDDIHGGFTFTGRAIPNAFNVNAVIAYRVYVDGRPDELVRGVDLIGTPLATFAQIVAAGDTPEVFNGSCGAESGWVPVSAVSPPLLVARIETQRKAKGQNQPPLLPPPTAAPPDAPPDAAADAAADRGGAASDGAAVREGVRP